MRYVILFIISIAFYSCFGKKNNEDKPFPVTSEIIGEPGEWFVSSMRYVMPDGYCIYVVMNNKQDVYYIKDKPKLEYLTGLTLIKETIPLSQSGQKQIFYRIEE